MALFMRWSRFSLVIPEPQKGVRELICDLLVRSFFQKCHATPGINERVLEIPTDRKLRTFCLKNSVSQKLQHKKKRQTTNPTVMYVEANQDDKHLHFLIRFHNVSLVKPCSTNTTECWQMNPIRGSSYVAGSKQPSGEVSTRDLDGGMKKHQSPYGVTVSK